MSHTLSEQTVTINNTATFNAWLTDTLGYTLAADGTAYSPKDPTFGIKFTMTSNSSGDGTLKITYDGGKSYITIYDKAFSWSATRYHVSQNEDVIYWRTWGSFTSTYLSAQTFIIAHTNKGKTVFFSSTLTSMNNVVYSNVVWKPSGKISIDHNGKTNSGLYNAISKCPAFIMDDVCKELYLINSVQSFNDLQRTFISNNGVLYRVVSCYDGVDGLDAVNSNYPCFAFPVSD